MSLLSQLLVLQFVIQGLHNVMLPNMQSYSFVLRKSSKLSYWLCTHNQCGFPAASFTEPTSGQSQTTHVSYITYTALYVLMHASFFPLLWRTEYGALIMTSSLNRTHMTHNKGATKQGTISSLYSVCAGNLLCHLYRSGHGKLA